MADAQPPPIEDHRKSSGLPVDLTSLDIGKRVAALLESSGKQDANTLVYLGNWHDAYPRLLAQDPLLDAVEVRVWLILHIRSDPNRANPFPDYAEIGRLARLGSRSTVSKALKVLRATRWISLCATRRTKLGQVAGNLYALHDQPVSIAEAMLLDPDYMGLLERMAKDPHAQTKSVSRQILRSLEQAIGQGTDLTTPQPLDAQAARAEAYRAAAEIGRGEAVRGGFFHTRFDGLEPSGEWPGDGAGRNQNENGVGPEQAKNPSVHERDAVPEAAKNACAHNAESTPWTQGQMPGNSGPELSTRAVLRPRVHEMDSASKTEQKNGAQNAESTKWTQGQTPGNSGPALSTPAVLRPRVHEMDSCSSSSSKKPIRKTTTTGLELNSAREPPQLIFPQEFTPNERKIAARYVETVDVEYRQQLLDEVGAQVRQRRDSARPVRNPIGLLSWFCQQIRAGEFPFTSASLQRREQRERQEQLRETLQRHTDDARKQLAQISAPATPNQRRLERLAAAKREKQTAADDRGRAKPEEDP